MNNFWGPSDDEEPLPAWMDPNTYRNGNQNKRPVKSLAEAAADALKKPPLQQIPDREPNI